MGRVCYAGSDISCQTYRNVGSLFRMWWAFQDSDSNWFIGTWHVLQRDPNSTTTRTRKRRGHQLPCALESVLISYVPSIIALRPLAVVLSEWGTCMWWRHLGVTLEAQMESDLPQTLQTRSMCSVVSIGYPELAATTEFIIAQDSTFTCPLCR